MQIQSCQKKIQVYPFSKNTTVSVKNTEFFLPKILSFFYQKEPSFFFYQKVPHNLQKTRFLAENPP